MAFQQARWDAVSCMASMGGDTVSSPIGLVSNISRPVGKGSRGIIYPVPRCPEPIRRGLTLPLVRGRERVVTVVLS